MTPILGFIGGSLGTGELVLIFVVVLLLFGSKNLPKIARGLGRALEEFRRAAREVSSEIMREPEPRPRPAMPERSASPAAPVNPGVRPDANQARGAADADHARSGG